MPQPFRIKTAAFPASELLLESLSCNEGLSTLTEIDAALLSPRSDLDPEKILGQPVTFEFELRDGGRRFFNGYVTRFSQTGASGRFHRYQAVVRPWLWFLTRTTDCRIFQNMKVPDIVKTVFEDHRIAVHDSKLFREYREWEYCVQYRESDFNFVSRLLEHEGIYYRFEHSDGKHQLLLLDSASAHDPQPDGAAELSFYVAGGQAPPDIDFVDRWSMSRSVEPGRFAITDYDFENPGKRLLTTNEQTRGYDLSDAEAFDYPGFFAQASDGEQLLENRRDEAQSRFEVFGGATNARGLRPGFTFKLKRHPRDDQNAKYLVSATSLQAKNGSFDAGQGEGSSFHCDFTTLPSTQQFRPPRRSRKPFVQGPQTAVVVGKSGEEIHTDRFGRVRVQFHWDRLGKRNERSSCFVRVAQAWAGKSFGAVFIPRVGHEVIVDFLEGDPDQPIITGCVYNGDNLPPWALPDHATQSGVLTRSSKGGAVGNANMIRFEDKKGSEQLAVHAERNLDISVEVDETHTVGHDRKKTIDHDETTHVKHDRTETVDHDEQITIGVDRTEKVGANEDIKIGGNRSENVGSDESVTIGASRTHTVGSDEALSVGASQTLNVAASQTHTVGGSRTDTVGGSMTQTIGGALSQTVGGPISITTAGAYTLTAPGGVTFVAPGGTKFIDFAFEKIGGKNMAQYGVNIEGYVLHNETSAIATAQKGVSVEASTVKNAQAQALIRKLGFAMLNTDSAVLNKSAVYLAKANLTLIG